MYRESRIGVIVRSNNNNNSSSIAVMILYFFNSLGVNLVAVTESRSVKDPNAMLYPSGFGNQKSNTVYPRRLVLVVEISILIVFAQASGFGRQKTINYLRQLNLVKNASILEPT